MREIVRHQFVWGLSFNTGSSNNFFQSLGNIYFPLNSAIVPSFALAYIFGGAEINPVLVYTFFSIEIFLVIYIFCRYFQFSKFVAQASGWLFILLVFPIVGIPKIYGIMSLTPQLSTGIAQSLILVILIDKLRDSALLTKFLVSAAVCFIIAHIVLAYPAWLMLVAPFLFVSGVYTTLRKGNNNDKLITFFFLSGITLILVVTGFASYFVGLFNYTAATFFPSEVFLSRSWEALSAATSVTHYGYFGTVLVLFGLIGAFLDLGNVNRNKLASITLLYAVSLYLLGITVTYFQIFSGLLPAMVYFEFVLWPMYIIYAVVLVIKMVTLAFNFLHYNKNTLRIVYGRIFVFVPILFVVFIAIWANIHTYTDSNSNSNYPYPPKRTAIFDKLKNDLALLPGECFKGRVATFYGQDLETASWFDLAGRFFKEDLILLSFHYLNIPTLFEYNQLSEPTSYMFMKEFLAKQEDTQIRSVFLTRRVNKKILRLLGVKYALLDREIDENISLVLANYAQGTYLYEIEDVNYGNYTPTILHKATDARDALSKLSQDEFDPKLDLIVFDEMQDNLSPASSVEVLLGREGRIKVIASSKGTSVLVLPMIFSNCIDVISGGDVELFRADFFLTGLKFSKDLNVELMYFTGPLHNSSCRIQDIRDANNLGVKNLH